VPATTDGREAMERSRIGGRVRCMATTASVRPPLRPRVLRRRCVVGIGEAKERERHGPDGWTGGSIDACRVQSWMHLSLSKA